jgi:hypothetical protein
VSPQVILFWLAMLFVFAALIAALVFTWASTFFLLCVAAVLFIALIANDLGLIAGALAAMGQREERREKSREEQEGNK